MPKCLLIVDLQNDYFPGGNMELVGIEEAAENAQVLLKEFRKSKSPVIHIRHISLQPGATFFLPETDGAKINRMVAPQGDEIVVTKNFPNSFRDTALLELLKKEQTDHLVICGAMSHMCIDATTRAAFDLGLNCTVAEDACATRDLVFKGKLIKASDVHASFMAALSALYAKVISTREVIGSGHKPVKRYYYS
jgi:nicotinamidase-related amidase